jgi:aspartate 1-decarboxylase
MDGRICGPAKRCWSPRSPRVRAGNLRARGQPGTGKILINGGAAHLIKAGERVTIMAFAVSGVPVEPKILLLDEKNDIIREGR